MVKSSAKTVREYLKELPEDRRAVVSAVRDVIVRNLPRGYREAMGYGMINYEVPLELLPDTYNGQPLCYAGLAAQKNYYAIHLMCVYGSEKKTGWLKEAFQKAGKKLEMGKACIRFHKLEDLPLDVIGQAVAGTTVQEYVAMYVASRKKA
ncbi:MAG TPA: DUF1801 domain-containing protein [Gemmataceae bacterium]|nr:DUF1801 domain-containing protein [Gemmataceae bacterium]